MIGYEKCDYQIIESELGGIGRPCEQPPDERMDKLFI